MVVPHRDFVELDPSVKYFRVFLPIEDNRASYHSDTSGVFLMRPGELWYLDASIDHAAANFSTASRQFLCFDFAFNGPFQYGGVRQRGVVLPIGTVSGTFRAELINLMFAGA